MKTTTLDLQIEYASKRGIALADALVDALDEQVRAEKLPEFYDSFTRHRTFCVMLLNLTLSCFLPECGHSQEQDGSRRKELRSDFLRFIRAKVHGPLLEMTEQVRDWTPAAKPGGRARNFAAFSDLPDDATRDILSLLERGDRLSAIKRYRKVLGVGLVEAKQAIDEYLKEKSSI